MLETLNAKSAPEIEIGIRKGNKTKKTSKKSLSINNGKEKIGTILINAPDRELNRNNVTAKTQPLQKPTRNLRMTSYAPRYQ